MTKQSSPTMGVDARGRRILQFQLEARNLARLALLRELIAKIFDSGDWRTYSTALGREQWRQCEFDYFLIACDIKYADCEGIFDRLDHGRALAAATQNDDPRKRRPLEDAARAWHAPGPETLVQRAERLGWIHAKGGMKSPATARARAYVRHGHSADEHAQQQRQRHVKERRAVLDAIVAALLKRVPDDTERRYIIDRLREVFAKRGTRGRPVQNRDQWARDIAMFKGDAIALAKHWGLKRRAVFQRLSAFNRRLDAQKKVS